MCPPYPYRQRLGILGVFEMCCHARPKSIAELVGCNAIGMGGAGLRVAVDAMVVQVLDELRSREQREHFVVMPVVLVEAIVDARVAGHFYIAGLKVEIEIA